MNLVHFHTKHRKKKYVETIAYNVIKFLETRDIYDSFKAIDFTNVNTKWEGVIHYLGIEIGRKLV